MCVPEVARKQIDAEAVEQHAVGDEQESTYSTVQAPYREAGDSGTGELPGFAVPAKARRYHGSVRLDSTRVGRDASKIAEEVIAHLAGLKGADVRLTLEIEADIPDGAPEDVVRIVTENSKSLKFEDTGFESE